MVEVQQQELVVLKQIVEFLQDLKDNPIETIVEEVSSLADTKYPQYPSSIQEVETVAVPTPLPSKYELCKLWFEEHPEDIKKSNRELAITAKPMSIIVSQAYWGRVKRDLI